MAKDKKSFLLYTDLIHTVRQLPDDKAGALFKHILEYVNDNNPQTDDIIVNIAFEPIKQALKRDWKKYEGIIKQKQEGGTIGNLKRWHPELYRKYINEELSLSECMKLVSDQSPSDSDRNESDTDRIAKDTDRTRSDAVAKIAVNDSVSVNVNDIDKEIHKGDKSPTPKVDVFFFKKELLKIVDDKQLVEDWLKVRKLKRSANTKTAFEALKREFDKSRLPPTECVKMAVENSWSGFKASWLNNNQKNNKPEVSLQNPNGLWANRRK